MAISAKSQLSFTHVVCGVMALSLSFVPLISGTSDERAAKPSGLGRIAMAQVDDRSPAQRDAWLPV